MSSRAQVIEPGFRDAAITCEVITEFSRLQEAMDNFERSRKDQATEVFQTSAAARAWWRSYGHQFSLCSPVVVEGEQVLGILPLVARGDTIHFLGSPGFDYNDLWCDERFGPIVLREVVLSLFEMQLPWKQCVLDNVSVDSRLFRYLPFLPDDFREYLQVIFKTWCPRILLGDDRQELLNRLSNKVSLRRHEKKLEKVGRLTFRHLETRAEIREHLNSFFRQHIQRNAMNGGKSQFRQTEHRAFFEALVDELDPQTQLRFGVLDLDDRPIAYHFGFQWNGSFVWYKPAFNVDFWEFSPGEVLLRNLLQYARKSELLQFDFTVGNESFKSRFANNRKEQFTIYLDRKPKSVTMFYKRKVRRAIQGIRRNRSLHTFVNEHKQQVKGLALMFQNQIRTVGPATLSRELLLRLIRRYAWEREEVLLLYAPQTSTSALSDTKLKIRGETLSTLASLSDEYPHLLSPAKLHEARERLTREDRAYTLWTSEGLSAIAWAGVRQLLTDRYPELALVPELRGTVVYELWLSHERGRISSFVLSALPQIEQGDSGVWIRCPQKDLKCSSDLVKAGLEVKHRVRHLSILHWYRRVSLSQHSLQLPSTRCDMD